MEEVLTNSVPQLIENYRCGSAEAISITFLLVWFLGDLTNLIGALWAHLVPVVIAIAVYFCIADGVLISQPLLSRRMSENMGLPGSRRRSSASLRRMSSPPSAVQRRDSLAKILEETEPRSVWLKNISSVLGICATGVVGWAIAWQTGVWKPVAQTGPDVLEKLR
ncbi:vacuolar membrane PQ loop repeat containing protein [Coccidioides immitis RMSCC 3703]|uniref:Vacuolar membrane PQ loop repeat containing protein n=1 Tax=Coccidioides immitis RMSCC 3703 TaxID=454286 RepID=A0A0J8QJS6_COCIT|nr:vacuolar membrane PQ loop repeat containing protein [Coccidioides immitis RMSCC 3703]